MVNMKKILLSGVAVAALFAAAPAFAADVPVRGPVYKAAPAPVFNWTGFYFGGHVGYGWGDATIIGDVDGFIGGAQVGYNWQLSRNWVFGVEADISGTDMNSAIGPTHVDYVGTLRARIGYAWDRTMVYGTGGFAFSRAAVAGLHDTDTGYALGLGVEWAIASNWSAKVEYMYYDFSDFAGIPGVDADASTIKVGLNYRFGY
jgi:outer membrane immunogenic protein